MAEMRPQTQEVQLGAEEKLALVRALVAACGGDEGAVAVDGERIEEMSKDMSFHESHRPTVVATPATTEEVAAVVRACVAARVPMVPRGAGTGLEGGAIPYCGGVVICMERLRRMEVLETEMMAVVGAGIYKEELNKFVAPMGLLFGPDPASNPCIGGMASTGGSGMTTLRYGTTKENVVSLTVVTPQGEILQTRRPVRKSSSGYELTQLYMGAEGTLGIICELTVRLKKQPPLRSGGLLPFVDLKSAVDAVVAAVRADPPSMVRCELLNAEGVDATNVIFNTTIPVTPTLFLEMRGTDAEQLRRDFDMVVDIGAAHGCDRGHVQFASDGAQLDAVWEARRGCNFAARRYRKMPGGDRIFSTDVCVPLRYLADCVSGAEGFCRDLGLKCVICAHIADGNFHCLIPHQADDIPIVKQFEVKIIEQALASEGTVSGEHGIGVGKIGHSCREHGPVHVAVQQAVKRALDPLNLMNPGKVLPAPAAGAKL